MHFGHILVALDGSPACAAALGHACWLARQGDSTLTGLFVIDTGWADFIGNDWQSSSNARQGFLDHIGREQDAQAQAARSQFAEAAAGLGDARFELAAGDPVRVLLARLNDPGTDLCIFARRTFQVSGRPSLKSAARALARHATRPLLLLP
ncbi:universal stress protein [uncultured Thiodictyon sp.]|uniref:universal stress protein n=1 Tax=uncultured Thiodictyon sp. TaxID=1846217 RepID=UPI0025CC6D70|nr:universal stress protein [uncultured Thiodictyon sp.]